jgi:hypothetical protein
VIVSVVLFSLSLAWTLYTIGSNWGTDCFNVFNVYVTLTILISKIIWDNFIKTKKVEG